MLTRGDVAFVAAILYLLCLLEVCYTSNCPQWWSLGKQNCSVVSEECSNCEATGLFTTYERKLCSDRGEKEVVKALSRGLWSASLGCQNQFSNTLWNCPLHDEDIFHPFVCNNVTRETAIVGAFLSAGAVHGIATACKRGVIEECPCIASVNYHESDTTYLHTCNDNVESAVELVKEFYNIEASRTEVDLVKKWNYDLGYQAVNETSTYCRCTGLSGSCVLQTCYERAPSMDQITSNLRKKYEGSQKVEKSSHDGNLHLAGKPDRAPIPGFPVHLDNTPDLCDVLVTRGRVCDPNSSGSDSCNSLCCDHSFEVIHYTIPNERCRFVWCCRIECVPLPPTSATIYRCL